MRINPGTTDRIDNKKYMYNLMLREWRYKHPDDKPPIYFFDHISEFVSERLPDNFSINRQRYSRDEILESVRKAAADKPNQETLSWYEKAAILILSTIVITALLVLL